MSNYLITSIIRNTTCAWRSKNIDIWSGRYDTIRYFRHIDASLIFSLCAAFFQVPMSSKCNNFHEHRKSVTNIPRRGSTLGGGRGTPKPRLAPPPIFWLKQQIPSVIFTALYVVKQNFKTSTSEYLRCAPKYTISRLNNQKLAVSPHPAPPI